jgi:hypothetical protein
MFSQSLEMLEKRPGCAGACEMGVCVELWVVGPGLREGRGAGSERVVGDGYVWKQWGGGRVVRGLEDFGLWAC